MFELWEFDSKSEYVGALPMQYSTLEDAKKARVELGYPSPNSYRIMRLDSDGMYHDTTYYI